jgi:hypothetical protein
MSQYKTGCLSSSTSPPLQCLWIPLHLVSIIWLILFQLPSRFKRVYPSPILYNSSLRFLAHCNILVFLLATHNWIITIYLLPLTKSSISILLYYKTYCFT